MIRVGFFETNRGGWASGRDGECRHSPVPGANSRRAAGLAMYTLAGNPGRSMRRIFWHIVLDSTPSINSRIA
jgi:hypothetical protein